MRNFKQRVQRERVEAPKETHSTASRSFSVCIIRDDETGLPTVPPGVETNRELIEKMFGWEGEGTPESPQEKSKAS